ncbi:hypothetical protein PR048_007306 [Dryococelus australis]|uniref:Uncharacterized protein n=1 Tax=Dryococelus australis TaxID=614101 RepID=A0ABQ9ID96_9NEOP|nr:hypothetical protein PR048_007306 [Dryococelus australis]
MMFWQWYAKLYKTSLYPGNGVNMIGLALQGPPAPSVRLASGCRFPHVDGTTCLIVSLSPHHVDGTTCLIVSLSPHHVFSGIFCFPLLYHSVLAPYSPRFTLIGSQDLEVKSRPNISTPLPDMIGTHDSEFQRSSERACEDHLHDLESSLPLLAATRALAAPHQVSPLPPLQPRAATIGSVNLLLPLQVPAYLSALTIPAVE